MDDVIALHRTSVEQFGTRVLAIGEDQWHLPTPNTDWDVRALVNHLVNEELWAPPLLAGETPAEVGSRFDGDLLGDDPKGSWRSASRSSIGAAARDTLGRTVHVSFGEISAEEYLSQLTVDHTVHAWDLARAIGADEQLDPGLVEFAFEVLAPQIEQWREFGVFGPAVEVPSGASRQLRLLGLTGRIV